ncbi:hypothetical protein DNTS_035461 [Danionella cerebrum]|uniref:Uncharacterized protein n=1 Tax=Danionella cerebrum TaxID=2873325 RepID=A0A553R628_9TELE|nr:hypothetical protein DNTS_035461 [Danionella translucida]
MALRSYSRQLGSKIASLNYCINKSTKNAPGCCLSFARIKSLHEMSRLVARTSSCASRCQRRSWHQRDSSSLSIVQKLHSHSTGFSSWTLAWSAVAFSLFGSTDERTEEEKLEDELILLLKQAKYSMMIGELESADGFLHKAVRLAHQMHNNDAIIYTYSLMGNLAFVRGQLDNAEKLFKAAMSFMLSGGTAQDDNAVIEMSLKLASIYATQNKNELAEHGFQFCAESLEAKIEKQKELPPEDLSDEERKDTRLLLGLSLDARARYLASNRRFKGACRDYRQALQICSEEQGESHPQTLVLMSDLATVLDLHGKHDEALIHVQKAVELGRAAGQFEESVKLYEEALALARAAGDEEAIEQLHEGLKELSSRKDQHQRPEVQEELNK